MASNPNTSTFFSRQQRWLPSLVGAPSVWPSHCLTPDERTRTCIMVDVIADTLKRIEAAGGQVLTPRTAIGSGMGAFAVFVDPVGNEFGLYEEPSR